MKKSIFLVSASLAAVSFFAINQPVSHAASFQTLKIKNYSPIAYHPSTFRSVYLYNLSHTAKLHNLKNYPRTTWYVSKKILMHSSLTGKNYAYFYVTNAKGDKSGIVWHGYLTRGVNPNANNANSTTGSGTNTGSNNGSTSNDDNSDSANTSGTVNYSNDLSRQLAGYFEGVKPNAYLQKVANKFQQYANIEDPNKPWVAAQDFEDMVTSNYPDIWRAANGGFKDLYVHQTATDLANLKAGKTAFKDYANKAIYADNGNSSFRAYKGYQIGAYACPKGSKGYGQGVVILVDGVIDGDED